MPESQSRRSWIKLWTREYIHGTTRTELNPAERSLWVDFMALAGDSPKPGHVCIAEGIGYTDDQLCQLLKVENDLLAQSIKKMIDAHKIKRNGTGVIEIINFWKYQPRFDRDAYQREYMANKRKTNTSKSNKLDNNVSLQPVSSTHKEGDIDIEIDRDNSLNKTVKSTEIDQPATKKTIFTPKGGENSPQNPYDGFKELLLKADNPIPILISAMKQFHSKMPKEDKEQLGDRIGSLLKNKYHPANKILLLQDIITTSLKPIEGSHLDYLTKFRKGNDKELLQIRQQINKKTKSLTDIEAEGN